MTSSPSALQCPSCGAPLTPAASEVRVSCAHCGVTSEIATEGALRIARVLARAGVTVAPRLTTTEEIEERLRLKEQANRARQRTTALIIAGAFLLLGLLAVLTARPASP